MRLVLVCSLLTSLANASVARADSAAAEAVVLFDRGKQLMRNGKLNEACAAFESSQKLAPALNTLLNHADCREKNGQFATAWGLFREAERQTRQATTPADTQLHDTAERRASKLRDRYSKLAIVVARDHEDGLVILRDGEQVESGAWNSALPIDGGTHEIIARAPGHHEWSIRVTVKAESHDLDVTVPELEQQRDAPPARRSRVVPIVLTSAALALAGGAIALELSGETTYDRAVSEPDPQRSEALWASANLRRHVAEGLGIAAVGCAGVALYLLVRQHDTPTEPRLAVGPLVGTVTGAAIATTW